MINVTLRKKAQFFNFGIGLWLCIALIPNVFATQTLDLNKAINLALMQDPWLKSQSLQREALIHQSKAVDLLPNPMLSLGLNNLPSDSWDLAQENMTQINLGVSQVLPRGNSTSIRAQQLQKHADTIPFMLADRQAQIVASVTKLYLDIYLSQQTIQLIEADRALFEQLGEVARANYENATGQTRQHDVIRAQLELVQLEDRLAEEQQRLQEFSSELTLWLPNSHEASGNFGIEAVLTVEPELPNVSAAFDFSLEEEHRWMDLLNRHPAIRIFDQKMQAAHKGIELSKQSYKPQWRLNAKYGYRDNMPNGEERSDLFSIGVSVELPIFNNTSNDHKVSAAIVKSEAIKTDRQLAYNQLASELLKTKSRLHRLNQRLSLYHEQLLTQMREQSEASLTAYTNDEGSFSEVMRANIAELNAKVAALKLTVERLKVIAKLNYFLASPINPSLTKTAAVRMSEVKYDR